ncbi:MAG: hypothetical protein P4M11_05220 [Candidatus Pacebacteria bacterium]|nr:hypothetical protein [Candidatus Paceibacterota bacterium]
MDGHTNRDEGRKSREEREGKNRKEQKNEVEKRKLKKKRDDSYADDEGVTLMNTPDERYKVSDEKRVAYK